jgi:DNA-binding response OmpR family regulator
MLKQRKKSFVVLHFCCNPTILTDHGIILSNLGYRVIHSANGFETIQLSLSGNIDAVVLELDRNHSDILLIAREIERVRASIPTIVVVHATEIPDGLCDVADAVVPKEMDCGMLAKSLEQLLGGADSAGRLIPAGYQSNY